MSGSQSALTASANVTVGDAGTGVVSVGDGGSLDVSSGTLTIGAADGGIGTVAVSGTDVAATLGGLVVGDIGKGTL
jgi:T5SS/PEP-CTERM-associated repeat protein